MIRRNLTGQKFNKLTAVSVHHVGTDGQTFYIFMCDCGNTKVIRGPNVSAGGTKSCGCLGLEPMPKGEASFNNFYFRYKKDAKKRKLEFSISKEDFALLVSKLCFYCGASPREYKHNERASACLVNGLDRTDNSLGYTVTNVVPCCKVCNRAKSSMSLEEFKAWIARLVAFNQNREGDAMSVGRN